MTNTQEITLDCDVIIRSTIRTNTGAFRGKVVGIGDHESADNPVLSIRPHGALYVEKWPAHCCTAHNFDDYVWLQAETAAAGKLGSDKCDAWGRVVHKGIDLALCLPGEFYFDEYKRVSMAKYLSALESAQ